MALRRLALLVAVLLTPIAAIAQQTTTFPTTATSSGGGAGYPSVVTATGTLSADDETVGLTGLTNLATAYVTITDNTWNGSIYIEGRASTSDVWHYGHCINGESTSTPGQFFNTFTGGALVYSVSCPIAGLNEWRLRATGWVSGTATIYVRATPAPIVTYAQITNAVAVPVSASILSGTGSRVRTGDWFGGAFTASTDSDATATASAQIVRTIPADNYLAGSITATDEAVAVQIGGAAALSVLWSNTWVADVVLEKSLDNVSWETIDTVTGGAAPTTVTTYAVQGFKYFRARGTTISSGSADVQLRVSATPLPATGGGGGSGDGAILDGAVPTRKATVTASNALKVDGSAVTQPVSGPLTDAQLRASAVPVSGTFWQATQPVSGTVTANLGTIAGVATAAKQPALGTAGTPSADVITVQGKAAMTPILVDGSATTQPVSGSVGVTNFPATYGVTQSGAFTVTANAGTNLNTSALALESGGNLATVASVVRAEDSASADGDKGITLFARRTATPANTSGTDLDYEALQMAAGRLWVDASGKTLTVDGSGVTQPVSGTFWQATQPVSGTFWQATQPVSGTVTTTPPANASTNVAQLAGTTTDTNSGTKSAGTLRVVLATDQPALTNKLLVTPDSVALPANQSVNVAQVGGTNTVTGGVAGILAVGGNVANAVAATANPVPVGGIFTTTPATLTTGQTATLQFTAAQNAKHDLTTIAGTAPTTAGKLDVKGADGDVFVRQATGTNLHAVIDSGSTTVVTGTVAVNHTQIGGVTVSTDLGVSGTGVQRVVLSQEATYAASTTAKTATASGTAAFFEICGSGTKTIRIQRIAISGTIATTAVYGDIQLRKNSAAATGGTATTLTNTPYDSNAAAATAAVKYFTVLPTGGATLVGNIFSETAFFPVTATAATFTPQFIYQWRDTDAEPPTLRGTAQCLTAGFGTAPGTAPTLSVSVAWTEK